MRILTCLSAFFLLSGIAAAFNDPKDTAGPLKVSITAPDRITETETAVPCSLTLTNEGADSVSGTVSLAVIDGWRTDPSAPIPFSVPAGETLELPFTVFAASGSFNAIYPIHARAVFPWNGTALEAHPIKLVRTEFQDTSRPDVVFPWKPVPVNARGKCRLLSLPIHRTRLDVADRAPELLADGFLGTEGKTRAVINLHGTQALPDPRETLFVHPPWYGGIRGAVIQEYPLALPSGTPLRFECAVAIQPQQPGEPPSDGVTFRVRVVPGDAPENVTGEILCETHTDAKSWQPLAADLSAYAGQFVRIQLETSPGPAGDTTCDRGLWGAPAVFAGDAAQDGASVERQEVSLGVMELAGNRFEAFILPSNRGFLDGRVIFRSADNDLYFDGFPMRILSENVSEPGGLTELVSVKDESGGGVFKLRHSFQSLVGTFDLVGEASVVREQALSITFRLENQPAPKPWLITCIEDAAAGPWNRTARRVYAGMGNVLCRPEAFSLAPDGHQLATSFVGFDFDDSFSLVQALEAPPSRFTVTPQERVYTLHAGMAAAFTFIPAPDVWNAVRAWREVNGLQAASGVPTLAGRFAFDLWGGRYRESAEELKKAFHYGLTNSVVVWHNWQRYGYDYRLPDITPPNPDLGSLEDFQYLARVCRDKGVLFAPHDNYIDFYPDAEGFSYEHIAFHKTREPVWAWLNTGRGAQAFRWRPSAMRPFLEKNVTWIQDEVQPTAFFIDVWSSLMPGDNWTQDGWLEDRVACRAAWGDAFAWIRETLGDNAPQISESGHDQLIGKLDGAQANHLRVDASPPAGGESWTVWPIPCEDAERVPWSDMAHHDRFVYHGAGYDPRYRGGLRGDLHGIYSDDYLATEILTGHPSMVAEPFGHNVVRKYWLTNGIMTALAQQPLHTVVFDGDDIHRQQVSYENGARVWVNRGESDWQISGHTLPPFGFFVEAGEAACAVERLDGVIVEWSRAPGCFYVNARPEIPAPLPVTVKAGALKFNSDNSMEVALDWMVSGPVEDGLTVFVHFMDAQNTILFQADHRPEPTTGTWNGAVTTLARCVIPATCKPGDVLQLHTGLWLPGSGRRPLLGTRHGDGSILLGTVRLEGEGDRISGISFTPSTQEPDPWLERVNAENKEIHFDGILTNGGFRAVPEGAGVQIMPLPDSPAFTATIDLDKMPFTAQAPTRITTEKSDGTRYDGLLHATDRRIRFQCEQGTEMLRLLK